MDDLRVAAVFRASAHRMTVYERMKTWRGSDVSTAVSHTPQATVYTSCSSTGVVRVRAEEDNLSGSASFYGEPAALGCSGLVTAWLDLLKTVEAGGTAYVTWKGRISEVRFSRGLLFWEAVGRVEWDQRTDWDLLIEKETWTGHVHRYLDLLAQALVVPDPEAQKKAVSELARAQQHLQRVNQELSARRGAQVAIGRSSGGRG
ncbi:hypothetical protein CVV65_10900 [Kyrpidia spormannii]|uniref:Uncharacterized protein n=2 Tax=Kyrpidia spormannii TaxID=2055160 RepID=A0A2K8N7Q8_9BACL|nr:MULTISPECIES: hypothetical protein [Kyrpidia]HHY68515.1 hypothetical protein [Alicyclobacillus sp.]ATY85368.1 hypothetical protein CVV65_10900 [Kyrpidia spormannii]MCL6576287.1 hypothetical protein [Kyrpidia sp.]CAB3393337.1 conserved protein of unknown function [Kyrpidia spormannii]CAB3394254.1 conserved protein of unknown function [Kyrpidia spormannii]